MRIIVIKFQVHKCLNKIQNNFHLIFFLRILKNSLEFKINFFLNLPLVSTQKLL